MSRGRRNITIIGCGLALLYGISFFNYIPSAAGAGAASGHETVIAILFLALFFCTIPVISLKDWARRLFVILNAGMGCYFLVLYVVLPGHGEPSYIFMNIAAVLFYSQPTVSFQFHKNLKFDRKSILVIDDDEGVQKTLQSILLPNGYSVLTATTGEKGLQVATLQKPDLIILDVILPGIKGREVCIKLKEDEKTLDIPVIFLTSKDSPDDVEAELAAGAVSHLTKPVNPRLLLTQIKKALQS